MFKIAKNTTNNNSDKQSTKTLMCQLCTLCLKKHPQHFRL